LHNDELHNLQALQNIVRRIRLRRIRWERHVACMGKMGNTYRILVGKTLLGRHFIYLFMNFNSFDAFVYTIQQMGELVTASRPIVTLL
jgi:hypothetical protein